MDILLLGISSFMLEGDIAVSTVDKSFTGNNADGISGS
jgi:hypothetical protein